VADSLGERLIPSVRVLRPSFRGWRTRSVPVIGRLIDRIASSRVRGTGCDRPLTIGLLVVFELDGVMDRVLPDRLSVRVARSLVIDGRRMLRTASDRDGAVGAVASLRDPWR
jgi:hypothetical protein